MNKLIIPLLIFTILIISGCEDKITPEQATSVVDEANRLRSVCIEQINTNYNTLDKVDDATYSDQLRAENSVCNEYRGYLYDNLNILDYNAKGERDNWGTNQLAKLDQNDEANNAWFNNHRDDNSDYRPIVTPSITLTPKPTSQSSNIGSEAHKCHNAYDKALNSWRTEDINSANDISSARDICTHAYNYYVSLPSNTPYKEYYVQDMLSYINTRGTIYLLENPRISVDEYNSIPDPGEPSPYN